MIKPKTKQIAILALALLEFGAMVTGNDGMYLVPVVAVIAGLAGYSYKDK